MLRQDAPGSFPFGLSSNDRIALHHPNGVLVQSTSWTMHVQSIGWCPNAGGGGFVTMAPSFGSANVCP